MQKAAEHTAQARAINDEFEGKAMPAEAAHQMEQHLKAASEYRARVNREAALEDVEGWIKEPDYKHDMSNGATVAESYGHGTAMLVNMVGLARIGHSGHWLQQLFLPFYWLLASLAAYRALFQLFTRPHHWDKTQHVRHG